MVAARPTSIASTRSAAARRRRGRGSRAKKPLAEFRTQPGSFENTPLMIDNVLARQHALQPRRRARRRRAGASCWAYDPRAYEAARRPTAPGSCTAASRRGAIGGKLRIFLNSRDRLICLDAETGEPVDVVRRQRRDQTSSTGSAGAVDPQALTNTLAARRLQGPRHRRQRRRRSPGLPERSARRRARVRRADRQAGVDVPHRAAARRVRQRHVGRRVVEGHRATPTSGRR